MGDAPHHHAPTISHPEPLLLKIPASWVCRPPREADHQARRCVAKRKEESKKRNIGTTMNCDRWPPQWEGITNVNVQHQLASTVEAQQLGACLPSTARDLVERSFDLDLVHPGPSSSGTTPGAIPMRLEQSAGNLNVGTTRKPIPTMAQRGRRPLVRQPPPCPSDRLELSRFLSDPTHAGCCAATHAAAMRQQWYGVGISRACVHSPADMDPCQMDG